VISVGVDIIEVERIRLALARWQRRFSERVYTKDEIENCNGDPSSLATRFAAKEAVMKVLGTGTHSIKWQEIEILSNDSGKPFVKLYGNASTRLKELHMSEVAISISDTRDYAVATAIGT
jgi:holo-[acyl-carrier protein] synthase